MKTNLPLISIIIANRNGEKYLKTCITSVLKSSTKNYEIIFIDNKSTDSSIEIINEFAKKDARIRILINEVNRGVPFSRNRAIKEAKGDILVFLDNDTKVDRNWLQGISQVFSKDKTIGGVQCKIFDFDKTDVIQEIGMKLYPYTGFGIPLGRGEKDNGQFEKEEEIIALGAALAVRKEVAGKIGGFDLKLKHTTDDLDFSWRIWIAGYRVVLAPNSKVYHYTKVHNLNYKLYFHLCKNSIRMLIKNYELSNTIKYLPFSLILNTLGAVSVLFRKGSFAAILGVLQGLAWSLFFLSDTLKERSKVQSLRKARDKDIFGSIMISTNIFNIYKIYFRTEKTSVVLMK